MIKSWKIKNIKSYRGEHETPLSWINIIAGANSSGKSTFIQSILLLKQTILYGNEEKSLLLNGPLLRLGSFDDLINSGCPDDDLSIGFEFSFSEDEMRDVAREWMRTHLVYFSMTRNDYISRVSVKVEWKRSADSFVEPVSHARFSPTLSSVDFGIEKRGAAAPSYRWVRLNKWGAEEEGQYRGFPFRADVDAEGWKEVTADKPDAKMVGGYVSHFLPQWVVVDYDSAAKRAGEIANALFSSASSLIGLTNKHDEVALPENVTEYIYNWLEEKGVPVAPEDRQVDVGSVKALVSQVLPKRNIFALSQPTRDSGAAEKLEQIATVSELLCQSFGYSRDVELAIHPHAREGAQFLTEFFKTGIRYLGPLRDPPRPVYQLEALPSTTDVGYRGEHTAAILDLNARRSILYHRPPTENLDDDYISKAAIKRSPLQEAVVDWLSYLGVAEDVATSDEGVFGNRLRVATEGERQLHDLTNVGVGVSQVLPIVVMALLAPKSCLIIFEQPELHLHPRVQARLADFFLSLALSGKQILAETHSEYLIDRFRLRVALSETDNVLKLLNILFSNRKEGSTDLIPIELSEYGAVLNWPRDFFDQSQVDVSRILKAASAKRRSKRPPHD